MRRYTRQQLKEDRFQEATAETLSWLVEHQKVLMIGAAIALVVAAVAAGAWVYLANQNTEASLDLGRGIRTYNAPLRPQGMPASPDQQSFASAAERAKTAKTEFETVVQKYPHTQAAEFARYYIGLADMDLGDNAGAEKALQQVAGARDKELSALANVTLAGLYRSMNKPDDAVKIYQDLAAHPTVTVPKSRAQLDLASLYETKQPAEARKLYEQIIKENPNGVAAQAAQQQLAAMK